MAPNTATPTADPTDRANMLVPVATPRCPHATLDCATTRAGAATQPMPKPIRAQPTATCHSDAAGSTSTSTNAPAIASETPSRPVARKPIVRYSRPETAAATGQPSVRAARAKPLMMAEAPRTSWPRVGTYDERPRMSPPTRNDRELVTTRVLVLNTQSGRTGDSTDRSTSTKATSSSNAEP